MKNRLLVATGNSQIDLSIKRIREDEVVGTTLYKDELEKQCEQLNPDTLIVTEMLNGQENLTSILLKIKTKYPNLRIIYLTGEINIKNEKEVNPLALLAMAGIYDIITEKEITLNMLNKILDNPKGEKDVDFLIKATNKNINSSKEVIKKIDFIIPEEYKEVDENIRNNLYVISSIKPGTGKSFVSVNIATAIAEYGIDTNTGKRPKVGLIEADLQNLSLGTLLGFEDDNDKNIKAAMDKIGKIVSQNGDLFGNAREIEEVNDEIKKCFIPYYKVKNLKALVGSQLTFEEVENITGYHYMYLIDAVIDDFDVLIVDTNSALTHTTTFPLLSMSKNCYYILNLDFNNVRNNLRYKETLKKMGISDKVKYILNEDISNETNSDYTGVSIEKLIFTADHLEDSGFNLEARIPVIPKTVFLNRLYEGTPIVLDENKENKQIRYEILKIANQIYPIKDFGKIQKEMESPKEHKKFFS